MLMKNFFRHRTVIFCSFGLVAWFIAGAGTETASAKCGPQPRIHAASASGDLELKIEFGKKNKFAVLRKGAVTRSGEINVHGHHLSGIIDDAGKFFVLFDTYEGLTVYEASGRMLKHFPSTELLSIREERTRPGKWACHMEGVWLQENHPVSFDRNGAAVVLFTHAGRRIVIDLASAQVAQEDRERLLREGKQAPDDAPLPTVVADHEHDYLQASIVGAIALPFVVGILAWGFWRMSRRTRIVQQAVK
jgi:hypothetical protein